MHVVLARWDEADWPDVIGPFEELDAATAAADEFEASDELWSTSVQWLFSAGRAEELANETT